MARNRSRLDFSAINFGQCVNLEFTPQEAVLALLYFATASDGYVSDDEATLVNMAIGKMELFRSYPSEVVRRMFVSIGRKFREGDVHECFQAIRDAVPQHLIPTVFSIVADLVMADGDFDESEQQFLERLYQLFDLDPNLVHMILQVMSIRHRG